MKTVLHALDYFSKTTPDKLAVVEGISGKSINYFDLWNRVRLYASYLKNNGLSAGQNVALHVEQTIDYVCAYYGTMLAAGIALPVEPGISKEKLKEIANYFNAKFTISSKHDTGMTFNGSSDILHDFPLPGEEDIAAILYTTGTTGASKGVLSTYRCRFCGSDNVRQVYGITDNDTALIPQVLSHSGGLRRFEAMLISGGTVVTMNPAMFFGNLFKALHEYKCTVFQLVPAQVAQILQSAEKLLAATDNQLRILSVGSAVIPESHKERLREILPNVRLFNDFGSTEAIGSAYFEWSAFPPKPDCVGIEAPHSKIVFLDDNGNDIETSPANPGIIATEGGTLMSGYYKEPELTAAVLKNGRLISADLGYRGEDGMIYIVGRKTDIIVSGANKISPFELEEIALGVNGIIECAVIGKPDDVMGQLPAIFISVTKDFDKQNLIDILNDKLERYKIPKAENIYIIDKLPRTDGTGKIIKRELEGLL
jgi:acyl-CoA synthetase (AMP-forming)/AMP-acid ligase II